MTSSLLRIVEDAHSLAGILDGAVRVVARNLHVDACSAFLVDEQGRMSRAATFRLPRRLEGEQVETEAELVAARAGAERRPVVLQAEASSLAGAPMILRGGLVGALVLQNVARREFSADDVATLAASSAQLVAIVEDARIIEAIDRGEMPAPRLPAVAPGEEPKDKERVLFGVAASPGVAIGTALFRGTRRLEAAELAGPVGDPGAERARLRSAIAKAHGDVLRIQAEAAREIDEEHALIFASHLLLLNDPMLLGRIDEEIGRGVGAPAAIVTVFDEFESRLRLVPDPYIEEKIDDVDDLRGRLLGHLRVGEHRTRVGERVVISQRIAPSLVVELKTEGAQALVTSAGGGTSHGVLLARAMGIPAVTGIANMVGAIRPDDRVIVDGAEGLVVVRPTDETVSRYEAERRRVRRARAESAKYRDTLARTADGVRVAMYANVAVASDLVAARENGAEGIGLYRTEFPFIVRETFPTRAEQARIYAKAYEAFPDGPIHFRILDLAGDKFVPGSAVAAARSAFHGYRSIRVLFDHPHVLRDQVQALALAANGRLLHILVPMVSSLEELRRVKAMIDEALASGGAPLSRRAPAIGALIEVPAAVEMAEDIAREVDFLSIGTNDLMQYTLVVDREDSRMARMSDPYHPAILRMIARVAKAARAAGKPLGVCGEIAVRPDVALAMIALGVSSLSVVPTAIAGLKHALAGTRLEPVRDAIDGIVASSDAAALEAALRAACSG